MGIGLYRRPQDGAIFAIVSPKAGPKADYLWQYRLRGRRHRPRRRRRSCGASARSAASARSKPSPWTMSSATSTTPTRSPASTSGTPIPTRRAPTASWRCSAPTGYQQDREGLGIYDVGRRQGLHRRRSISCRARACSMSTARRRARPPARSFARCCCRFTGGADGTDGLDVTSAPLGPDFPDGLLVAMNSASRNFLLFRWGDVMRAAGY